MAGCSGAASARVGHVYPVKALLGVLRRRRSATPRSTPMSRPIVAPAAATSRREAKTVLLEFIETRRGHLRYAQRGRAAAIRRADPWLRRRSRQLAFQHRRRRRCRAGLRARPAGPWRLDEDDRRSLARCAGAMSAERSWTRSARAASIWSAIRWAAAWRSSRARRPDLVRSLTLISPPGSARRSMGAISTASSLRKRGAISSRCSRTVRRRGPGQPPTGRRPAEVQAAGRRARNAAGPRRRHVQGWQAGAFARGRSPGGSHSAADHLGGARCDHSRHPMRGPFPGKRRGSSRRRAIW